MIFIIHYILLNAGLPAITILLTVFLSKYSDGTTAEIGTLLMVLPLVSTLTKPAFCALADRHRAHKEYLICFLFFMLIGYGSFVIIPFTDLYSQHPRTSWYVLVVLTVIGYLAWSVVWSLGDSLCVNWSIKSGTNFGAIRKFGTMSWGVFGLLIGQINEVPGLPTYVAGFIVFAIATALELVIVACWNKDAFAMVAVDSCDSKKAPPTPPADRKLGLAVSSSLPLSNSIPLGPIGGVNSAQFGNLKEVAGGVAAVQSAEFDVNPSNSLRMNVRLAGAVANILIEDIGSTISGTLRSKRRIRPRVDGTADDDVFRQFEQLTPQATLSRATGANIIAGSQASNATTELAKSALANQQSLQSNQAAIDAERADANCAAKEDLQLALFKLIVSTKEGFFKYIVLFGIFGIMFSIHITFFFMHVEALCIAKGYNFSRVTSYLFVSQSISETAFFILAPAMIRKLGRPGAVSCCMMIFAIRYTFYGFFYELVDPYYALAFETCHGFAYGIAYSLVTDVALDFANEASELIPQLMAKGLIEPSVDLVALELSLRATFQGCYSGIFDGLGWGLGSLIAGLYLSNHSYTQLWVLCSIMCLATTVLNQLNELRSIFGRKKQQTSASLTANLDIDSAAATKIAV